MSSIGSSLRQGMLLALLSGLLRPCPACADQQITLEVTESEPPTYASLHARAEQAVLERHWTDGECVSVNLVNRTGEGPAYRPSSTGFDDWVFFISADNQILFLSSLGIESQDVGLEFTDSASALFLFSNCSVKAPIALSEKSETPLDGERLHFEANAQGEGMKTTARIEGDLNYASGHIELEGSDLTVQGKGLLDTLLCSEFGFVPAVSLTDAPEAHRSSFLLVKNLELNAGTVDVNAGTYNAWLWTRRIASPGSGECLSVRGRGALILGEVFDTSGVSYLNFQNGTDAVADLTTVFGLVELTQGSARPTLLTRGMDSATEGIGKGTVRIGTVASATHAVTLGTDSRWILMYEKALAQSHNTSIVHEPGAQLVIYGWDGVDAVLPLAWEADTVSLVKSAVPRAKAEVLSGNRLHLTREWMQNIEALKSKALVKVVEDGWGTLATYGPGRSYIARALEDEAVGRNAFVNLVDTSVALPFSSGIALASERAFESVRETLMQREFVKTDASIHYWAEGGATKIKAHEAFGEYGLKAETYRVGLGADVALKNDWTLSGALFGVRLDAKTRGNTVPIESDASMVTVSAMAEKEFSEAAVRFSLTGARSSASAKRVALEHILTTDPVISYANAALSARMHFGERLIVTPSVAASVNFARIEDASVEDTGTVAGISGTAFSVEAKNRLWGEARIGCAIGSTFSVREFDWTPRLELSGRASFGDRRWKTRSSYPDSGAYAQQDFASASRWQAKVVLAFNVAHRYLSDERQGGFLGFGSQPTGKRLTNDWALNLRCSYAHAEHGESALQATLEFRKNW